MKKVLAGGKLAGGNPENGRVEFDYYATNPKAVEMLLTNYTFDASTILEPCIGGGHIADTIMSSETEWLLGITAMNLTQMARDGLLPCATLGLYGRRVAHQNRL